MAFDKPFSFGPPAHAPRGRVRAHDGQHSRYFLRGPPSGIVGAPALYTKMRPVCTHNRRISDFTTWNGLLVLAGLKADAQESTHVYMSDEGKTSLWFGGIDDLWKFGKPTGVGGPWKKHPRQKPASRPTPT